MEFMIIGGLIALVIMAVAMKLRKEKDWVIDPSVPLKVGQQVKKIGDGPYLVDGRVYKVINLLPEDMVNIQDTTIPHNFFIVPRNTVAALVLK